MATLFLGVAGLTALVLVSVIGLLFLPVFAGYLGIEYLATLALATLSGPEFGGDE